MKRSRRANVAAVAGLAALATVAAACGSSGTPSSPSSKSSSSSSAALTASAPGITATTITIGSHQPLTGVAAPGYDEIAPSSKAYFQYVNAHGGIYGRKIVYNYLNDQYNPTITSTVVHQLVHDGRGDGGVVLVVQVVVDDLAAVDAAVGVDILEIGLGRRGDLVVAGRGDTGQRLVTAYRDRGGRDPRGGCRQGSARGTGRF